MTEGYDGMNSSDGVEEAGDGVEETSPEHGGGKRWCGGDQSDDIATSKGLG